METLWNQVCFRKYDLDLLLNVKTKSLSKRTAKQDLSVYDTRCVVASELDRISSNPTSGQPVCGCADKAKTDDRCMLSHDDGAGRNLTASLLTSNTRPARPKVSQNKVYGSEAKVLKDFRALHDFPSKNLCSDLSLEAKRRSI